MSLKSFIWGFPRIDVLVLHRTVCAGIELSDIITEQQSQTVFTVKEDNERVQHHRNELWITSESRNITRIQVFFQVCVIQFWFPFILFLALRSPCNDYREIIAAWMFWWPMTPTKAKQDKKSMIKWHRVECRHRVECLLKSALALWIIHHKEEF